MKYYELKPMDHNLEVIPDDDEERLKFYDELFREVYEKNLRLEVWDIAIGMASDVKGDYCLLCHIRKLQQ